MGIIRCADLFGGIGGIRLGFEQVFGSDFQTTSYVEIDEEAQETYLSNHIPPLQIIPNIRLLPEESLLPMDIICAGFPCQAFSTAGKQLGFEDTRGTLFFEVARLAKFHQPKVIFCENVAGLLTHDNGKTLQVILNTLTEIGYKTKFHILNGAAFGSAQSRKRIYLVSFLKGLPSDSFSFPTGDDYTGILLDVLEDKPVSLKYYLKQSDWETLQKHRFRNEGRFSYKIRDVYKKSGTLLTGSSHQCHGIKSNLIIDKRVELPDGYNSLGIRSLTPREYARLQGYPDSFRLPVNDDSSYHQMGNSVQVPVIRAIAQSIQKWAMDNMIPLYNERSSL